MTGDVAYVLDPADPTSLRERVLLDIPSMGMMPGGEVELIVGKGSVVYVRAPMLASYIPAKTPWIKLDPSALPQQPGGVGAATAALDPAAILAALEGAISVDEVGTDTVDGADATHYRATVDLVKLLPSIAELAPDAPTDAEMQEAKDQLTKLGLDTLPIELWVDGDGYLKQVRFALDLSTIAPDRRRRVVLDHAHALGHRRGHLDRRPAGVAGDRPDRHAGIRVLARRVARLAAGMHDEALLPSLLV